MVRRDEHGDGLVSVFRAEMDSAQVDGELAVHVGRWWGGSGGGGAGPCGVVAVFGGTGVDLVGGVAVEGGVGPVGVVDEHELGELVLQLLQRRGWASVAQPLLEGLMPALDLAAGLRVSDAA